MFKNLVRFVIKENRLFAQSFSPHLQCRRHLNIHENSAHALLKISGIPIPKFGVAKTPEEAKKIATELDTPNIVLKAQVLAGGRAKGNFVGSNVSGVEMCETPEEAKELASKMLGRKLVTKQTGEAGRICNAVMVTQRMFPRKEYYLAVMMERSFDGPVIITSKQGGVNIEDVAATKPEAIIYTPINPAEGLSCKQADEIACDLGVADPAIVSEIVCNLYELFVDKDALLLEINPLVQDICGYYYALDCKCNFDDSADFRQNELFAQRDWTQEDPNNATASKFGFNYVSLDGNIGCMVNGAGLAMATMDIIKLHGGEPANFLDVGGGASVEAVVEAFKIIASNAKVESILINIFGGIVKCDLIAEAVITAFKKLNFELPVVIRLRGTNAEKARKMIAESTLKIIPVDDFSKAAEVSVAIADICRKAKSFDLNVGITPTVKNNNNCR